MPKTITITVPLKGIATGASKPTFETQGFSGTACQTASEFLSNALGQIDTDELTAEAYEEQPRERISEG